MTPEYTLQAACVKLFKLLKPHEEGRLFLNLNNPRSRTNGHFLKEAEQAEFLKDVARLIDKCFELGFVVTGGELFRTPEQQTIYLQRGLSKTSNSMHLKRCAIDLNFFKDGELIGKREPLIPVGEFWQSLNPKNRWGGNFKNIVDCPHFERNVG
jgi:hypothetical protein